MRELIAQVLISGEPVPAEAWGRLGDGDIEQGIDRAIAVADERRAAGDPSAPTASETRRRGRSLLYLKRVHEMIDVARRDFAESFK